MAHKPQRFRPELPADFTARVIGAHGERGKAWLTSLPQLITRCAARWSLTVGPQTADLSYNYVVRARLRDGTGVILKLGVPHRELGTEAAALRAYDGQGAVRLLAEDAELGILLLEEAEPGEPLWEMEDERAAPIIASVMQQLWRPAPPGHTFPTLGDWIRGFDRLRVRFDGMTGPLPTRMVEKAERLFHEMGNGGELVLLHGDLHHGNILSAHRAPWLAIDPKGVIGAREFEVGAFLRNPLDAVMSSSDPSGRLARRIAILSELLGFAPPTIRDCAFIQAMLSVWWTIEDGDGSWERPLTYADLLDELNV